MTIYAIYLKDNVLPQNYAKFIEATKEINGAIELNSIHKSLVLKTTDQIIVEKSDLGGNLLLGEIYSQQTFGAVPSSPLKGIDQLSSDYWGNYALFSMTNCGLEVFIPQCSQYQIFYYETNEYVVFSSEILFLKKFTKLSFNEEYFKIFLLSGDFISSQTPFNNINEVPAGYKVKFTGLSTTSEVVWSFYSQQRPKFTSLEEVKSEIKQKFNLVIKTILSKHDNVFLDLSGGLDSSSILLELCNSKSSKHKIYGVNLGDVTVNASNEIEHVKRLQLENEFELIRIDYNQCLPFSIVNNYDLLPNKPSVVLSHLKYQQMLNQTASDYHKEYCFINGHGGDSVFNCPPPIGAIADLFKDNKFSQITPKAHELALQYRKSIWDIYNVNVKLWIKHKLKLYNPLLRDRIPLFLFLDKINKQSLSFFNQLCDLNYPSEYSYCQIIYFTLANMQTNLRSKNHNIYYPFMSQPILETGLRINSYDSFTAEYNRYLFRLAMSEQHNTSLMWRKDKGHTTGVFHKGLNKNKDYLIDLCCNGFLINGGLINKQEFLTLYNRTSKGFIDQQWALLQMICLEIFITMWKNHL